MTWGPLYRRLLRSTERAVSAELRSERYVEEVHRIARALIPVEVIHMLAALPYRFAVGYVPTTTAHEAAWPFRLNEPAAEERGGVRTHWIHSLSILEGCRMLASASERAKGVLRVDQVVLPAGIGIFDDTSKAYLGVKAFPRFEDERDLEAVELSGFVAMIACEPIVGHASTVSAACLRAVGIAGDAVRSVKHTSGLPGFPPLPVTEVTDEFFNPWQLVRLHGMLESTQQRLTLSDDRADAGNVDRRPRGEDTSSLSRQGESYSGNAVGAGTTRPAGRRSPCDGGTEPPDGGESLVADNTRIARAVARAIGMDIDQKRSSDAPLRFGDVEGIAVLSARRGGRPTVVTVQLDPVGVERVLNFLHNAPSLDEAYIIVTTARLSERWVAWRPGFAQKGVSLWALEDLSL